jgi:translation initiation factor 2B subunit (eIF-2B alpha/beta/delta family)
MYPLLTYSTSSNGPSVPPQFVVVGLGYEVETLGNCDRSYFQYEPPENIVTFITEFGMLITDKVHISSDSILSECGVA